MTLQQFIDKWNGKKCDFDGYYGGQCVDLYRMYVQEVLSIPQSPGVVGAKDIWNSYLTEHFDRIENTPEGVPVAGDIMIWGDKYGQFGHVAIVTEADVNKFTCFSQNDPSGALCGLKTYTNWSPLLGWLHPKEKETMYRGYDLSNTDSMKVAVDKLCDILDGKYISQDEHQKIINELDSKSTEQAKQYAEEKRILEEKIRTLEELQKTEHSWADTADILERKLKAVLGKFVGVGVDMSIETPEGDMAGKVQDYLSACQADRNFINKILEDNPNQTPDGVLEALELLKLDEKTIEELMKQIGILNGSDTAVVTFKFGPFIIKIFKK